MFWSHVKTSLLRYVPFFTVFVFLVAGEAKDVPEDPRLRIVTGDITDASECEKLIDEATAATACCNMLKRMMDNVNYTYYVCYFRRMCTIMYYRERERGERERERERAQVHAKMDTHLTFAHICTYLHNVWVGCVLKSCVYPWPKFIGINHDKSARIPRYSGVLVVSVFEAQLLWLVDVWRWLMLVTCLVDDGRCLMNAGYMNLPWIVIPQELAIRLLQ